MAIQRHNHLAVTISVWHLADTLMHLKLTVSCRCIRDLHLQDPAAQIQNYDNAAGKC